MSTNKTVTLGELKQGVWNAVRGDMEIEANFILVKPEADKVTFTYMGEYDDTNTALEYERVAYVVHEEIFMFDENLAGLTLQSMSVNKLVDIVESHPTTILFDIFITGTNKDIYPNLDELEKLAYKTDVSEELEGFRLEDGTPVTPMK
ncbi:hypothetical protein P4493_04605 [Bacillus thuringiensis]|jgi:hypothetical protein|uniref:Uncharacterized protein n=3 Tax=Bacillus thuringiensis TaxID=1428 RepID=A0A0B5NPW5_BACTU|nr:MULTISPECIES: hypothetical protein [Bacillus]MEC2535158.1 hypothetical protein [Bacillus cereus]MED1153727.1 hypothetical protein [Bacillus paranthracis]OUB09401.1 hypothetical protein BK708_33310 [Bacillus thuringiensis serovar yunnanensis]AFQ30046.1 hypothetical protein BTF1_29727 [Bacillus thuringiensis HD-789]AJG74138.1 hypothetical protein BF38_5841 [Bacillus thuringiensis]